MLQPRSPRPDGATYHELIRRGALQHSPRTAIVCGRDSLTFGEVDQLSSQLAHSLHNAGATPGKRVGLLFNNGIHSVPLDFACVKAAGRGRGIHRPCRGTAGVLQETAARAVRRRNSQDRSGQAQSQTAARAAASRLGSEP